MPFASACGWPGRWSPRDSPAQAFKMKAQKRLNPLRPVLTSKCAPEFKVITWMRLRPRDFQREPHPSQGGRTLCINTVTRPHRQGKGGGGGGHLLHMRMTTTQCFVVKKQNRSPSRVSCTMSTVAKNKQANKLWPSWCLLAFKDHLWPLIHIRKHNTEN